MPLPRVLKDLLALPTAAFVESAVMNYVEAACRRLRNTSVRHDRYGNLLAHYAKNPPGRAPLAFSAHTDHPGFCSLRMQGKGTLLAAFRGWVEPEYFLGTGVRFWSGGRWVRGKISKVTKVARLYRMIGRTARPEEVAVAVREPVEANCPGMWDLPEPALKGDLVYARGCDDLAGAAAMLALLERLSKADADGEVYCLFTRAEEVGFIGAIGAARARTIPRASPVISIETSKTLPNAKIGDGPILRVGDRATVFTPGLTAWCERVARKLAERRRSFRYQRKLMDGGSCEATAYASYGYATTGACVALGNYHNMNVERKRIDSEYISLSDWQRMVEWFEALVRDADGPEGEDGRMRKEIDERFEKYLPLLRGSSA